MVVGGLHIFQFDDYSVWNFKSIRHRSLWASIEFHVGYFFSLKHMLTPYMDASTVAVMGFWWFSRRTKVDSP